jgi:hypothetical protein
MNLTLGYNSIFDPRKRISIIGQGPLLEEVACIYSASMQQFTYHSFGNESALCSMQSCNLLSESWHDYMRSVKQNIRMNRI